MTVGIFLTIFTTILLLLIIIFNHKLEKLFSSYWFYLITSVIFLVPFFVFRWGSYLKDWINKNDSYFVGGLEPIISKVLLLDMCPFNFVAMSILFIVKKDRELCSLISPLGIIGGGITIYGEIALENSANWFKYIFSKDIYYLMHLYIFIMSFIVLLNTKCFNIKKIIYSHLYALGFFVYITIISFSMNINWNVTGIRPNDWSEYGQYSTIGKMINLPWPLQPILVFGFTWIVVLLMFWIRNIMVLNRKFITYDIFVNKQIKKAYVNWIYKLKY